MSRLGPWYTVIAVVGATITISSLIPAVQAKQSAFCRTFSKTFRFKCTEHRMHSIQGFELVTHRLRNREEADSRASPVLVMHPEFLNGDSWFQFTDAEDRLLPLLLLNAGFDVWVGHERATYCPICSSLVALARTLSRFWNWTWDDHAEDDVPVFLEYISKATGSAVHYIGLSQSATVGAASATMLKNSRFIKSLTLVGPTIYIGDTNSAVMAAWAFTFGAIIDEANYDNGYQSGVFNTSTLSQLRTVNIQSVYLDDYAHFDLLWSFRRTRDIFFPVLRFLRRH
ncbi:hypothetical protein R1sor_000405 [Riccia sorocarpa]|uniref:Triacylglycerol lipase n=1 Tax=Riccia sorocarpa TaxID=122646 RepID=A0ABD3GT15_9MARC